MAGDWLKMEHATPDKPETFAMAGLLSIDDPDLVVGKLFRVWRWFDQHTVDGNASGVTSALLDRIACCNGFATAMERVGWLVVTDGGLSLPKFDRHNGKTAKTRAETARRVAKHRGCNATGNDVGNDSGVTSALAREEKNTEEKKEQKQAPQPAVASARFVFAPPDWVPAMEWAAFLEMRRKARKPFTNRAAELAVQELDRLRGLGNDPALVLNQSVMAGWSGLFELKADQKGLRRNDDWRGVAV